MLEALCAIFLAVVVGGATVVDWMMKRRATDRVSPRRGPALLPVLVLCVDCGGMSSMSRAARCERCGSDSWMPASTRRAPARRVA